MVFDVHFWESFCFILLVAFSYRPVKRAVSNYLDNYAMLVKEKVTEAESLCGEASKTFDYYMEQHQMFEKKIGTIAKNTEENIQSLKQQASQRLEEKIKVKKQIQQDRIQLYNKQELHRIKELIINKSMTLVACYLDDAGTADINKTQVTQVLNSVKGKSITFH